VQPQLAIERANQVVAMARLVFRANSLESIPYGFSPYSGYFNPKGEIGPKAAGWGLTCATFILAVFDLAGVQLVRGQSWPEREEDREWQRRMITQLALRQTASPTPPSHVKEMRRDVGEKRFRPLEVAGAAAANTYPVEFPAANAAAIPLRTVLDGLTK
jgi:hypothetical protein